MALDARLRAQRALTRTILVSFRFNGLRLWMLSVMLLLQKMRSISVPQVGLSTTGAALIDS
jgi:hypothetical protein